MFSRLFFILILFSKLAFADNGDSILTKRVKIFPLPAFGYTPETRWYVGAVGLFSLRFSDDTLLRPSTIETEFNYTQNKQIIVTADFELRIKQERFLILGQNGYYKYPENYWGVGINASDESETLIEANRIEIDNSFLKRSGNNIFAGFRYRYHEMRVTDFIPGSVADDISGTFVASGAGVSVLHDSRDNSLNATRGSRVMCSFLLFSNFTGSKSNFSRIDADIRYYKTIHYKGVLAAQLVSGNTRGHVPVRMLPMIGGESIMRGYYLGRYRDFHMSAAQLEYRATIWNWVGVAAFAGCGTVYNRTSTLRNHSFLPNHGAGLRIRLDKKDNVNLRFDYGMGKNTEGFYVSFGEAF